MKYCVHYVKIDYMVRVVIVYILKILEIIPYESEKQYSAVFYKLYGELRCTVKGSLEKVMSFSKKDK